MEKESRTKQALRLMGPKAYFGQADGYPGPIKWFLWLAMLFVYPVWLLLIPLCIAIGWIVYWVAYGVLSVLFFPLRLWMMWKRPEQLAEWKERQRLKKQQQA